MTGLVCSLEGSSTRKQQGTKSLHVLLIVGMVKTGKRINGYNFQ